MTEKKFFYEIVIEKIKKQINKNNTLIATKIINFLNNVKLI